MMLAGRQLLLCTSIAIAVTLTSGCADSASTIQAGKAGSSVAAAQTKCALGQAPDGSRSGYSFTDATAQMKDAVDPTIALSAAEDTGILPSALLSDTAPPTCSLVDYTKDLHIAGMAPSAAKLVWVVTEADVKVPVSTYQKQDKVTFADATAIWIIDAVTGQYIEAATF